MFCKKCGNRLDSDYAFCSRCGTSVNVQSEEKAGGSMFYMAGDLASSSNRRETTAFMPEIGFENQKKNISTERCVPSTTYAHNNATTAFKQNAPYIPKTAADRKKKGLIIGLSAAMVFVLICAACAAFLILSKGPMTKIYIAAQNTSSASSYEAEFAVYSDGEREEYYKLALVRSGEDDEVTAVMHIGEDTVAIYNDCMLLNIDGQIYKRPLTDEIRKSLDGQTGDLSDLDIAEYLRQKDYTGIVYDYIEDYLDSDELDNCFKTYVKQLNDNSWLKNNAGYKCTRNGKTTTYCFDMDEETVRRFLKTTLETFEPAFRHESYYSDCQDAIAEVNTSLCLEMDVEGKYLTSVTCTVYGRHTQDFVITFDNIDNTEIDTDQIEYWYSIASPLDWLE